MKNSNRRLILASNSPRRKALLTQLGFQFEVKAFETDESFPDTLEKRLVAEYIAKQKNLFHRKKFPDDIIITADTTVIYQDNILGKPSSKDEACIMLKQLSNDTHLVVTGVCISSPDKATSFSNTTEVTFRRLADDEISRYIDECKPFDKAGAYGIQEWIGMMGVSAIKGSFFNVVGLPVDQVYVELNYFLRKNS
ncbi:MAG: septum formation protein Maf [Cyclobacteriaceae bacterium]|nr:septum formation protein Maf [Cyclobacteriaceae bacterium HetDA_MAG_MS6]